MMREGIRKNDQASSISCDDDEESTTSHEDHLEDWIEHVRSTTEADEKMLTCGITHWVETEETEVATSPTNCNTKPRTMDLEKRLGGTPRTPQINKDPEENRMSSQEMGRRPGRPREK